jgi:hypothetical protein
VNIARSRRGRHCRKDELLPIRSLWLALGRVRVRMGCAVGRSVSSEGVVPYLLAVSLKRVLHWAHLP